MLLSQWGEGLDTERERDRQTDKERDRLIDRQTDRGRDRDKRRNSDIQTGIQPHKVTRVDKGIEQ